MKRADIKWTWRDLLAWPLMMFGLLIMVLSLPFFLLAVQIGEYYTARFAADLFNGKFKDYDESPNP